MGPTDSLDYGEAGVNHRRVPAEAVPSKRARQQSRLHVTCAYEGQRSSPRIPAPDAGARVSPRADLGA